MLVFCEYIKLQLNQCRFDQNQSPGIDVFLKGHKCILYMDTSAYPFTYGNSSPIKMQNFNDESNNMMCKIGVPN